MISSKCTGAGIAPMKAKKMKTSIEYSWNSSGGAAPVATSVVKRRGTNEPKNPNLSAALF